MAHVGRQYPYLFPRDFRMPSLNFHEALPKQMVWSIFPGSGSLTVGWVNQESDSHEGVWDYDAGTVEYLWDTPPGGVATTNLRVVYHLTFNAQFAVWTADFRLGTTIMGSSAIFGGGYSPNRGSWLHPPINIVSPPLFTDFGFGGWSPKPW